MFSFGSIVLTRFPFTDLSGDKRAPDGFGGGTHHLRAPHLTDMAPIKPTHGTGLKVTSVVRFDKLATLDLGIIDAKLGEASPDWLAS